MAQAPGDRFLYRSALQASRGIGGRRNRLIGTVSLEQLQLSDRHSRRTYISSSSRIRAAFLEPPFAAAWTVFLDARESSTLIGVDQSHRNEHIVYICTSFVEYLVLDEYNFAFITKEFD